MRGYNTFKDSNLHWIKHIPEHWVVSKLKYYSTVITGNTPSTLNEGYFDDVGGIPWVKPSDLNEFNLIDSSKQFLTNEGLTQSRLVRKGAVLIGGIGDIGKLGYAGCDLTTNQQIHSIEGNSDKFVDDYLKYLIFVSIDELKRNSSSVVLSILTKTKLLDLSVIVPPVKEQIQIAHFLDHQTDIIDQLIQQKEKLIDLLKEKRQAVINEAVTKGLNPNAKMKDSDIEWLGEVPEHWNVAKIGHFTQLIRGASPRPAGDSKYFGGDFMPWITVGEVTNGNDKFVLSTENYLTKEGSEQSRIIYPETLLLSNSGATLGVPKISKITGCINDGSVAFISFQKELKRDFLFYFFKTHTEIYRQEMSGYGQPNLNTDIIKSTKIPLPPIAEQIEIVNYIESEFSEFDNVISLSHLEVEKLKEYRQSIISEAVTGKIDVREWQMSEPQIIAD